MKAVKVPFKDAEKAKRALLENRLLDKAHSFAKDKTSLYFPITDAKKAKDALKALKSVKIVTKTLPKRKKTETGLKEAVKAKLSKQELAQLKTSFDLVGDIAILEIDKGLEKKKKVIAQTLLKINRRIKTVLRKEGSHEGEFRTQKMEFLAGENKKETTHKENNVLLELDVEKVYFSARLSTERKRIAQLVRPNEEILVMFSGCAPYPCVLAKNTKAKHIVGIEINPDGHYYGLVNLALNHLKNVELLKGDVNFIVPVLFRKFDRIIMPLPKNAEDFLDTALHAARRKCIIHFYDFLNEAEFKKAQEKIESACRRNGKKYRILRTVKCGQHAPHVFRLCVDFQIL